MLTKKKNEKVFRNNNRVRKNMKKNEEINKRPNKRIFKCLIKEIINKISKLPCSNKYSIINNLNI